MTVLQPCTGHGPRARVRGAVVGPGQRGPMIVDDAGEVIWFHPVPDRW